MALQITDDQKYTKVRLPTTYVPSTYDIHLKPDFEKFTFEGSVKVEYASKDSSSSNEIIINSMELEILNGHVESQGNAGQSSKLTKVTYSPTSETATLEFDGPVPSVGSLVLNFNGTLNDKLKGFYRTSFMLDDTLVYAATTQFEAVHARRSFPCWDEPSYKAVFTVHLTHNTKLKTKTKEHNIIAVSCSPESARQETGEPGWVKVSFSPTAKMSTYLLAYIIGPFEAIEAFESGRSIRVLATPDKTEFGKFALDIACKSLRFYEEYFGIKYPLPKMDLLAVPDFASGAMENWGLIIYRESCILFDPKNTPANVKQFIGIVVCHEIAHQWFGNLVTMEWWTDLWLKEGFASFMEYLCLDKIAPEFDIWSQFATDAFSTALELDSLRSSHPIEVPINRPEEVEEIFDDISYNKGASIIRMVYEYIGDEKFRQGMKEYLTKYSYSNATTADLWKSLESASGLPICRMMSGWTSQVGYPCLNVSSTKVGNDIKLSISQDKFVVDGQLTDEDKKITWSVPVTVSTDASPNKAVLINLLESKSGEILVKDAGDSWVKLNTGYVGFYRANYSSELRDKLCIAVHEGRLPVMDRLGLQCDFFALCLAGSMKSSDLLKFIAEFKNEQNFSVWSSIDTSLSRIRMIFKYTELKDHLNRFGIQLYKDTFKKLTWEKQPSDSHSTAMLRALMANRLVGFGDEETVAKAKELFKSYRENGTEIQPDIRNAVYGAAGAYGDDKDFDFLFELYRKATSSEERNRLGRGMVASGSVDRLKRAIEFTMSNEVKNQDKCIVLRMLGFANPKIGWTVLDDYKEQIIEMYGSSMVISRLVKSLTENLAGQETLETVTKYFSDNKFPCCERSIPQAIETVRVNTALLTRDHETTKAFLANL